MKNPKHIYSYDHNWFIRAALCEIEQNMDRIYYNFHQKDYHSPFYNTGTEYSNDVFTVRSYSWIEDNRDPNFEYKDLKIWWYKHYNRGTYAECDHELKPEDINVMIKECIESFEKEVKQEL